MDDILIDIFRTVVGVKAKDFKWISIDELFENRNEDILSDLLNGSDEFELRDLIDGVDVLNAFDAVFVALMNGIHADKSGTSVGLRFLAQSDFPPAQGGFGLLKPAGEFMIAGRPA